MSFIQTLHQARKARLMRIAARAVAQAPEPGSKAARLHIVGPRSELDSDDERAWAIEILGLAPRRSRRLKVEEIQRAVARHFGVRRDDIVSADRPYAARPRQVAMYLARVLTAKSFPEIGRCFAQSHLVPAIQDQFGTSTCQSPGHRQTQPAAGTGDQRPAASEVEWRSLHSHAWRVLAAMARLSGVS